jgi:hypothetical protein
MTRRGARRALAAAAVALAAGAGAPGGAHAAPSCRNLRVTDAIRSALLRAHHSTRDGAIERGSIYLGACGATQYAIAAFSKALADQPERFRRLPGRAWVDKGDGFEAGCDAGARGPIPKALVRLWHVCPQLR